MCVLMGGGGAYAFGKIFQPFGHSILLEKIGLLLASENLNAGQNLFSESHGFRFFLQHAFLHMSKQCFGKVLLA